MQGLLLLPLQRLGHQVGLQQGKSTQLRAHWLLLLCAVQLLPCVSIVRRH